MSGLDETNDNVGYLLGRLFCYLEAAEAAAKGDKNCTVGNHFGPAMDYPVIKFFQLIAHYKEAHSPVLRRHPGLSEFHENRIMDIMVRVPLDFPDRLNGADGTGFHLGYYHQKAKDRKDGARDTSVEPLGERESSDTLSPG